MMILMTTTTTTMTRVVSTVHSVVVVILLLLVILMVPYHNGSSQAFVVSPTTTTNSKAPRRPHHHHSTTTTCSVLLKEQQSTNNDIENNDIENDDTPLVKTLGGGPSLLFEMARSMLVWTDDYDGPTSLSSSSFRRSSSRSSSKSLQQSPPTSSSSSTLVLPRWHPHAGISDVNPNFRYQSPLMTNQGYAGIIWRNVRKKNKPSLWRYALRTYHRMATMEEEQQQQQSNKNNNKLKIERTNVHHEGAMLACAKLGLWQEALDIYQQVEQTTTTAITTTTNPHSPIIQQPATTRMSTTTTTTKRLARKGICCVTDNMITSLITACVRGCKKQQQGTTTMATNVCCIEERRIPLDAVVKVLETIEERHGLLLVARHLNPLASAYQSLGLEQEASKLLSCHLQNRTSGPEEENGYDPFNVNDVRAKNKASYSLLVKGAVSLGDWEQAVMELKQMTEAGLYPNSRHLNSWTEVSERNTKQRTTRSWKKKREEYWLESVR